MNYLQRFWLSLALMLSVLWTSLHAQVAQPVPVTGLPQAAPESLGFDKDRLAKVPAKLQQLVDQKKVAGAVIAVARHGKLAMLEAKGMRDSQASQPMTTDTIFRIYSMSKPVTSVGLMMLVEQRKVQLDDPIETYLPEFADSKVFVGLEQSEVKTEPLKRKVTIRDLLRHTSGLTYGLFGNSKVDRMYRAAKVLSDDDNTQALVEKVAAIPLTDQPGERFQYGVSVDVMGRIIEVVSKQTLEQYLQAEIFEPLAMDDTGFFVPPESLDRFSTMYQTSLLGGLSASDRPATSRFASRPKMLSGGGGLVSTASDYLRFAQMVANGGTLDGVRILKNATVKQMTTNQLPRKAVPISVGSSKLPGVGFGLGFSVVVREISPTLMGRKDEYGWDGMASTHYWANPDQGLVVVVLSQRLPFSPQLKAIKPLLQAAIQTR